MSSRLAHEPPPILSSPLPMRGRCVRGGIRQSLTRCSQAQMGSLGSNACKYQISP